MRFFGTCGIARTWALRLCLQRQRCFFCSSPPFHAFLWRSSQMILGEFARSSLHRGKGEVRFSGGGGDTVFSKRWNTVVWDRFDIANEENILHSPLTALRERTRVSLLGTARDPFFELDDDVSNLRFSRFRCMF